METTTPTTTSPNAEVKSWFQKNKLWLFIAALFLVSNLGIYFFQAYRMGNLRKEFGKEMENKSDLASQFAQYNNERFATALIKPLAWGIRGEMMRGNKELVDQFLTSVVQETDLDLIAVVDMAGMVYLSTDKKYENKPVLEVIPTMPREVVKIGIQTSSPDKVVATSPIMGDVSQLGVLYFEANSEPAFLNRLKALKTNPFAEPESDK